MQIRHISDCWDWGYIKKKRKKKGNTTVYARLLGLEIKKKKRSNNKVCAHPGNRTLVSTVGGYYDTTTPDALLTCTFVFCISN